MSFSAFLVELSEHTQKSFLPTESWVSVMFWGVKETLPVYDTQTSYTDHTLLDTGQRMCPSGDLEDMYTSTRVGRDSGSLVYKVKPKTISSVPRRGFSVPVVKGSRTY